MSKPDWDIIEREFSKGILSNRQIAEQHGISETAIRKKAKQFGWVKDLKEKIRLATEKQVRKKEFAKSSQNKLNERDEIEIAAETQATIILTHRKDISKSRTIGTKLLLELESQTDNSELYQQLAELMLKTDANFDKLNDTYKKVISMPGRVDSFKKLTDSLKTTIGLERQAFGLADNANGDADKGDTSKEYNPQLSPLDAYKKMIHGE